MFEKYDGVRAFWNPEKKAFYTRTGKTLKVPQDLIDEMPNTFLDGEIWYLCFIFILHIITRNQVRARLFPRSDETYT